MYAIEELILVRKKLAKFSEDKYFLALTAASPEHNFRTEATQLDTQILSSWEHPFKHFMAQLKFLKCPRLQSKIDKSILDLMNLINLKGFIHGTDNRLHGLQLSRIEPTCVILFTASPKMPNQSIALFKSQQARVVNGLLRSHDLFQEVFRLD